MKDMFSYRVPNSPFSKYILSGLIAPKNITWASLKRVGSWLSGDTKLNFVGQTRPEKIIFEKGEFDNL